LNKKIQKEVKIEPHIHKKLEKMSETNNIYSQKLENLETILNEKSLTFCIIGIGRVGLPTALSFAKAGFETIGLDINTNLVDSINSGKYPLPDEPVFGEIFDTVITNKKFRATTSLEESIPNSDVIILCLPTPMDDENIPDYSALESVSKNLNKYLKKNSLVIVESTVEPGFIENEFIQNIEGNDKTKIAAQDFGVAVCPENANPGEIYHDFTNLPRLVAGIDEKSFQFTHDIYKHVFNVKLITMPNCRSANAVKLTTNVFRDINIAFVNELAILYEKLGIDVWTVLEAAKNKYNFQIHLPGPGVGGPCLPVNSYQFLNTERKLGANILNIIRAARNTNEYMSKHVISLLHDSLKEKNIKIENSIVTVLGISYKPNVNDVQIAPSKQIISLLKKETSEVRIFDPFFKSTDVFSHQTMENLNDALENSDALILVTAHDEFRDLDLEKIKEIMRNPILIDCQGIIDSKKAKLSGFTFKGIGRGEI